MKYLKLFEHYNDYDEVDSSNFYDSMHRDGSHDLTFDLTNDELNNIKNIFPAASFSMEVDSENLSYDVKFLLIDVPVNSKMRKGVSDVFMHVYKMDDEWYMVYYCDAGKYKCDDIDNFNDWYESHEKYYKCDQYPGLIKCLSDISKQV